MPFIKELVIHGFKSFAREEKIPFKNSLNCIVGPNGSGKSNVTDAICFVLGRMGSKSMRAKKLSNLIFSGTEKYKPSSEASVEIKFDNTDKGFSVDDEEVSVKRILRKNGQGVYKINGEVKSRQEVLELLGQAGIDPNGFNIVLQGEIESFVRMSGMERKAIIEEVAGISVYEMRKKRSILELEKTEGRLKETNAILRERNAYLRNLEEERKQALHFKKIQEELVNLKASVNYKLVNEKEERIEEINKIIEKEQEAIGKINAIVEKTNSEVAVLNDRILNITQNIQRSSGLEQEKLNSEISDLRADLAGLEIKKHNYETQLNDMAKRKEELKINIERAEEEIKNMSASKGKVKDLNVKKELEAKKKQLDEIDEQKRKLYIMKSTLSSLNSRIDDKQRQLQKTKNDYDLNFSRIEQLELEVVIKESSDVQKEKIVLLKADLDKTRKTFEDNLKTKHEFEKEIAVLMNEIGNQNKIKSQVSSLDICPLCKTKITPDHIHHVRDDASAIIKRGEERINVVSIEIKKITDIAVKYSETATKIESEIRTRSQDCLRLDSINEKKDNLRRLSEEVKVVDLEFKELVKKRELLEKDLSGVKTSETNYDSLRLEIQELQRHEELDVGMEVTLKQRDVERNKNILRQIARETEENSQLLREIIGIIETKRDLLTNKNDNDRMLKDKFKKTLDEKNSFQEKIHMFERIVLQKQNEKHLCEEKVNNMKIERAQFLAQKEAIENEGKEFAGAKIVRMSLEELKQKIGEKQDILNRIGSVNMKALETYDNVKVEYDKIQEKANKIQEEKQEILNVILDIDKKKKKAFSLTLEQINSLFSRNFSQLSVKGQAMLVPSMKSVKEDEKDDKEQILGEEDSEGIDMVIKVGKGKYFDTNSLSGGEKTLISLSLIFAIQEYRPYCFYILDEIDAALDRRNSERLAGLLKKYMNKGQYIIITHNDSLITESPVIYGVTMQDKISKVVSLEV